MSPPTIRGIRIARLHRLKPILRSWISLNVTFGSYWARDYSDSPWWYNERATLSFFAGAVWRAGGWAFEEFSTSKQGQSTSGAKSLRTGRCDINFGVNSAEYVAEAKQSWPILGHPTRGAKDVVNSLHAAERDARQLRDMRLPCLGIAFASPRIHMRMRHQLRPLLAEFVNSLSNVQDATVAWTFPTASHNLRPEGRNKQYIYPGVLVLIRRAA